MSDTANSAPNPPEREPQAEPAADPAGGTGAESEGGGPIGGSELEGTLAKPVRKDRSRLLHYGKIVLRLGLLVGIVALVWHELAAIDIRTARDQIESAHLPSVAVAILVVALAFAGMGLYDVLGFRTTRELPPRTRWELGMLFFAWTNFLTLGPIGGPAVRLYFYRHRGLKTPEIARGLVRMYSGAFGGLIAWVIAAFVPVGAGTEGLIIRVTLAMMLSPAIAALTGTIVQRFRPVENFVPITRFVKLGVIGGLDWGATFAVFYIAGRALGVDVPMVEMIRTVFAGQAVGMISMMPGGMGSADAVWLKMLVNQGVETNLAAAHILLFRILFYLFPWFISLIGLYLKFTGQGELVMRWQRRLLAGAIALNAAILLASSATPAAHGRLAPIIPYLPTGAIEASHAVAVVAAMIMVFLVRGLLRGYRASYMVTTAMLFASVVAHVFKGGDYEESIFSLTMLVLLLGARRSFTRRGRVPIGWELTLAAALGSLAFFLLVGLTAFTSVPYTQRIWPEILENDEVARFFRGAVLVGCVGLIFLLRESLMPHRTLAVASPADIDRAVQLIQTRSPRVAPLNIAGGDKGVWFWRRTDDRTRGPASPPGSPPDGLVVYQRRHRKMIVFSDPVVDDRYAADLIEELHLAAHDEDLVLVFYQISGRWMQHLHDFGYSFFKLGEEAIVSLEGFSLEGGASQSYRKTLRRVEAQGVTFNILHPPFTDAVIEEARRVSDAWLAHKKIQEMQFSLGYFSPEYLQRFPLAVARDPSGRMIAFVNLMTARPAPGSAPVPHLRSREGAAPGALRPAPGPVGEVSFDLMRYVPGVDSLMDFMVINLMRWGADQNYATLNLGMSPLHDVGEYRKSSIPERLARLLYEHGERIYNYRGVYGFKNKFRPTWEPRFMAYQRPWDWASAVITTTSLIWARTPQDRRRIERAQKGG
jgi:phosphatidylglycerol lysyltransferase